MQGYIINFNTRYDALNQYTLLLVIEPWISNKLLKQEPL